jgi:hypothetical protein
MELLRQGAIEDPIEAATQSVGINYDSMLWSIPRHGSRSEADKPVIFDWRRLQEGLSSCDEENLSLATTLKRLAGCLLSGIDGRRFAASTVRTQIVWYKAFFLSLRERGHIRMSLMSASEARSCFEDSIFNVQSKSRNSESTVAQRIKYLNRLHQFKAYVGDGFETIPYPQNHRNRLSANLEPGRVWEAPPEPVCLFLLKKSIDVLDLLAPDVTRMFLAYVEAVEIIKATGVTSRKRISEFAKAQVKKKSDDLEVEGRNLIGDLDPHKPQDLAVLKNHITTACFIIITYSCGPRVSEVRRATTTSVREIAHANGENYFYYYAARSKKRFSSVSLSSDRDVEDDTPWILSPAAVKAIEALCALSGPARRRSGIDNLWLSTSGNCLWPFRDDGKLMVLSSSAFNLRLNQFAKFIDLHKECEWHGRLHSHMGRKHLARFIAKRDRTGLGDLAMQYSHVSAYSVDLSYARPDSEFKRLVKDELRNEMEQIVQELTESKTVYTYSGAARQNPISSFRGRLYTNKEIRTLLARGTILVPCQWGVCMYRQPTSACGGSKTEPNPAERTPDVCSSCSNFVAYDKHRKWWEDYRDDSKKYLSQGNISRQVRIILERRLADAEKILADI